ncbi:hypothetical protein [Allonocardiopsis opalescens]|uniref:Uncharacterized protein n=1 Tax=Allonocardiopsis opalescens TaxID=1144618 RepID=A0A2T0PVJ2_9ACTN|nr:hypothetical protein [Allonocardiopsis opalescens]PRX95552.1 hypothetical protein CLV72_109161 [Allonocardiopsis opalescens]
MPALACPAPPRRPSTTAPPRLLRALPGDPARAPYRPRHARPRRTRPYISDAWERQQLAALEQLAALGSPGPLARRAVGQPISRAFGERIIAGLERALGRAA